MDDNMRKTMEQMASFQKLWMDSFTNMANVWSQFSPGSPPADEVRRMRDNMLKVLSQTWDEFMRTPQFMEMMRSSLNSAMDLRQMSRDGMNRVHQQFETAAKEDVDGVLLAIRHVERRVLDRLEDLDERIGKLEDNLEEEIEEIREEEPEKQAPSRRKKASKRQNGK